MKCVVNGPRNTRRKGAFLGLHYFGYREGGQHRRETLITEADNEDREDVYIFGGGAALSYTEIFEREFIRDVLIFYWTDLRPWSRIFYANLGGVIIFTGGRHRARARAGCRSRDFGFGEKLRAGGVSTELSGSSSLEVGDLVLAPVVSIKSLLQNGD